MICIIIPNAFGRSRSFPLKCGSRLNRYNERNTAKKTTKNYVVIYKKKGQEIDNDINAGYLNIEFRALLLE